MRAMPAHTHIVLVGGGHAHVTVVRDFGMNPIPGVDITLIAKELAAPYSGMLPGYVAGHYSHDDVHIDVLKLASWAGVRLIHGTVSGLERSQKRVLIEGRPPLGYDLLSIDVGITPLLDGIDGAREHGIAVKPVSLFADKWAALEARAFEPDGPRRVAVVGAGAAGFELILGARHRLLTEAAKHGIDPDRFSFTLLGAGRLLPTHNARAVALARRALADQAVTVVEGARVTRLTPDHVMLDDGRTIAADAVMLSTTAGAAPWFKTSGLATDDKGFLALRPTLQLLDDDDVFAAGDCATVLDHPREKAGVFAVRQGPVLTDNLRRRVRGEAAKPFTPQKSFLTLLSTGGQHAIAARNGIAFAGRWVWRWKDRIDRDFMAMFADLPVMAKTTQALAALRCAGCAAKVGPVTLSTALDRLEGASNITRDDAAVLNDGPDAVRLETIDFFRAIWPEPYVFGAIAAQHAMSDVFAMGGTPDHALANVVLPQAEPPRVAEDLLQLLAGAKAAFGAQGVRLIGGHSSEGAELAAGFFVAGRAPRAALMTKGGLRPGDRLIVTKPIGSGILFAALMRGLARGDAVAVALAAMQQSNAAAARVFVAHGARGATDVTGFGLAGHAGEMLDAAGLRADLDLASVPLYPTVAALARAGVASTLLPENARLAAPLGLADTAAEVLAVLFDPQTSGGLLAGVPEGQAAACLAALRDAGFASAAIIGQVRTADQHERKRISLRGTLRASAI